MPTKKATPKTKSQSRSQASSKPISMKESEVSDVVGQKLGAFSLEITGGGVLTPSDLKGTTAVIYFYPKDNTSGCTAEGENFRDEFIKFKKKGVQIFGVSRDSLKSHESFKAKFRFQFELVSDPDEVLCKMFDVMKMKSMYGRKYLGVERSTFVVQDGKVIKEWRNVKVPGHVSEVLAFVQSL